MSLFISQYMVHYLISRKVSTCLPPPFHCVHLLQPDHQERNELQNETNNLNIQKQMGMRVGGDTTK